MTLIGYAYVVKRCPRLVAPSNGHMSCTKEDFSYDTQCHFACNPGYKLVGSKSQACLAFAAWSGIPPKCRGLYTRYRRLACSTGV